MTQQPTQAPLVAEALKIADRITSSEEGEYTERMWRDFELLGLAYKELARQLEQANERHSDISAAELEQADQLLKETKVAYALAAKRAEQAEREKERYKGALEKIAYPRHWPTTGLGTLTLEQWMGSIAETVLSEQNTKPSGEVGEEA